MTSLTVRLGKPNMQARTFNLVAPLVRISRYFVSVGPKPRLSICSKPQAR